MLRVSLCLLATIAAASSSVTINSDKLFANTIQKWNVNIHNARDRGERLARFEDAVRKVESSTSNVLLSALNPFTVMNDREYEKYARPMFEAFRNVSLEELSRRLTPGGGINKRDLERERVRRGLTHDRKKRAMPDTYDYWENTLKMSNPGNQGGCGSCWSFPTTAAIEAINKQLTGDGVVFSEQYFVECTFEFSGCAGGQLDDGYRITEVRQYLPSETQMPYSGVYKDDVGCAISDDIGSFTNNAMDKMWLASRNPVVAETDNEIPSLIGELSISPIAFSCNIGSELYAYSGGDFTDTSCVGDPSPHAMLLVGYTPTTLRVRASYGHTFGEDGYVNYIRDWDSLANCAWFNAAATVVAQWRQELEYDWCNDKKMSIYTDCLDACAAKNTGGQTGWTLAVIPTIMHNQRVVDLISESYPDDTDDEKFLWFWTGLSDPDRNMDLKWADGYTPVNYLNVTSSEDFGLKWGLINKMGGNWKTKSSTTFKARGICSRPLQCFNIASAVRNGQVAFDKADLSEGTVATASCLNGATLSGESTLTCRSGQWDQDVPSCGETDPDKCSYGGEGGSTATITPSKSLYDTGDTVTITCSDASSTDHTCSTGGQFTPSIAACPSNQLCLLPGNQGQVHENVTITPPNKETFAEGDTFTVAVICEKEEVSKEYTCTDGAFKPEMDLATLEGAQPSDFCVESGAVRMVELSVMIYLLLVVFHFVE